MAQLFKWAGLAQSRHPTASEAPLVHVYTQIQLQKMPKLTKQAFFPCNPHTAVRSATDYAAAASPGAAQSGSGSSRLLGGFGTHLLRSLNIGLPPMSGFARKRHPVQNAASGWACAAPNRRLPSWCQRLPSSAEPGTGTTDLLLAPAGRLDGEGVSAAPVFLAEEHPREGDGRWLCGLARAAPGARLSARVWQSFV